MTRKVLITAFMSCLFAIAKTQVCTVPGQTPVSAVLVCGSGTLSQTTPALCGQTDVPGPCTDGASYQNLNPTFFRMACFSSGTLGFLITPNIATDNYNWQLFDITNANPFDIFTNSSLFVAGNWSPTPGETGATIDGVKLMECAGSPQPYSSMPLITQGRTYLLMVIDKTMDGRNYQLTFTGGSASITDPVTPQLLGTSVNCNATKINVWLNKGIQCNSVAPDGSDFLLSGGASIIGAIPGSCNAQGVTGLVTLTLSQVLPNGNYTLSVVRGSDGNTLNDLCGFSVAVGESIGVVSAPPQPTLLDSVRPVACKPSFIELFFERPILCNSIAPDASDFVLTGPQAVTTTVSYNCSNSSVNIIRLNLSSPLLTGGMYTIQLKNGTDGNTLIDECGLLSPPGSVSFNVYSAVSAAFTYTKRTNCKTDTFNFSHNGANGVNSWNWKFDNASPVTIQNPVMIYADTGSHTVRLIVSNGNCNDTSTQTIKLPGRIDADFISPPGVCPGDMITLISKSSGMITDWQWDLGNNVTSYLPVPPPYQYPVTSTTIIYQVRLITRDNISGCSDTAMHTIIARDECPLMVPTAFSPNNDGLNDFLGLLNTSKAEKPEFKVYNRAGQLVFASSTFTAKWDGKVFGIPADAGLFVWMLSYTSRDTGKRIFLKGTTMLVR